MIRRLALTLIPCVTLLAVAAFVTAPKTPVEGPEPVQQVAAKRSGYIVASS